MNGFLVQCCEQGQMKKLPAYLLDGMCRELLCDMSGKQGEIVFPLPGSAAIPDAVFYSRFSFFVIIYFVTKKQTRVAMISHSRMMRNIGVRRLPR